MCRGYVKIAHFYYNNYGQDYSESRVSNKQRKVSTEKVIVNLSLLGNDITYNVDAGQYCGNYATLHDVYTTLSTTINYDEIIIDILEFYLENTLKW